MMAFTKADPTIMGYARQEVSEPASEIEVLPANTPESTWDAVLMRTQDWPVDVELLEEAKTELKPSLIHAYRLSRRLPKRKPVPLVYQTTAEGGQLDSDSEVTNLGWGNMHVRLAYTKSHGMVRTMANVIRLRDGLFFRNFPKHTDFNYFDKTIMCYYRRGGFFVQSLPLGMKHYTNLDHFMEHVEHADNGLEADWVLDELLTLPIRLNKELNGSYIK